MIRYFEDEPPFNWTDHQKRIDFDTNREITCGVQQGYMPKPCHVSDDAHASKHMLRAIKFRHPLYKLLKNRSLRNFISVE